MLRIVGAALRAGTRTARVAIRSEKYDTPRILIKPHVTTAGFPIQTQSFMFSTLLNRNNDVCKRYSTLFSEPVTSNILSKNVEVARVPVRTVTKFSLRKGKRKSVKAVLRRFYRLEWGMWIRTKAGRHKKLWKKSPARKQRLRRHVMTTASQSWMLDKMVTKYWRRPKYYVDDPYNPYHKRESFFITQKVPRPA